MLSPVLPIEDQDDGNTRESGVIQNAGDPGRCSFRFRKTDGNLLDRPPKPWSSPKNTQEIRLQKAHTKVLSVWTRTIFPVPLLTLPP